MHTRAQQTSTEPQNGLPNKTMATWWVAIAGRRPLTRQVHYTRLVATIDTLQSTVTTNTWLRRLIASKITQAKAYILVIHAEGKNAHSV